ncbi:MAG: acetate--CoA ligase family protein [Chitinispirillaceae bacterium]|nr:acetate--CoA ligase family protein [Chitinispirillaceae bacterium]
MLDKLFNPRSVAVIGASQKALSIGNVITKNLLKYSYKGPIYPINPKADEVCGLKCYPSVGAVTGDIDLAHISIPAKFTPDAIDECGKKGIKFVIINSAGFKEIGDAGLAIENETLQRARQYGLRIFGPNCQGIINTDPQLRAYCDFTFTYPEEGHVSIVAQSGGVGALYMQAIHDLGVGMRFYASNGNACDISIPEILRYYGDDEKTRVIILYAEGFADPGDFMDAAREVAAKKPILGMRSGRTAAGAKAAASHTGGLAGVGLSTELIFKKTGILAFRDVEEMCQAAMAFATQPIPKGNRVGMITDTGGPAVIATDELCDAGLEIPPLSEKTTALLKEKLFPEASVRNPVDVLATAAAPHYRAALDVLMDEPGIDSVYINFVTPPFVDTESVAKEMAEVSNKRIKPIVCNYMTDKPQWTGTTAYMKEGGIPCYDYPEMAAKALAALTRYNALKSRPKTAVTVFSDVDRARAAEIIQQARNTDRKMLAADDVYALLGSYGIPVASCRMARDADKAAAEAEKIGFPVVIKADAADLVHKTDAGGVALNLNDAAAVRKAIAAMKKNITTPDLQFLVQQYLPGGREIIIGAKKERSLGHMIMFGIGGVLVELLKDVAFELTPVTAAEAEAMLRSVKTYPILAGYRGHKGVDQAQLITIIQRISQLVTDLPMIREMDLNPIVTFEDRVVAVDARIIIS